MRRGEEERWRAQEAWEEERTALEARGQQLVRAAREKAQALADEREAEMHDKLARERRAAADERVEFEHTLAVMRQNHEQALVGARAELHASSAREAQAQRDAVVEMSPDDRAALIEFLESL